MIRHSSVIAGGIHDVKPDGDKVTSFSEGRMWTGGITITQLRFGGADGSDIYFNSAPTDSDDTLREGGENTATNSFPVKGRSNAPGPKLDPSRFRLGCFRPPSYIPAVGASRPGKAGGAP